MNPIMTLTVEGNKVTAVGTVAVGEKIDVSVIGISADSVPSYEQATDGFTGPSLRLRIVDTAGRDLVRFPCESTDSWSVSNDTFTATNINLNTVQLRNAFRGVAYGDKLQFGIILDSAKDFAQYARGKTYVQQWAMASVDDPTLLPDWSEVLSKLNIRMSACETSETLAKSYKEAAEASKTSAASSASQASASASSAISAASTATTKASDAASSASSALANYNAARDQAGIARTNATNAATSAASAAESASAAEETLSSVVKKSGDTMTGTLVVPSVTLGESDLATKIATGDASSVATAKAYTDTEKSRAMDAESILRGTMEEYRQDRINADLALANGKADLVDGKVPINQLPSYVDDVVEYDNLAAFPSTGEAGKIYVSKDTNYTYRWSGSEYIQVGGRDTDTLVPTGIDGVWELGIANTEALASKVAQMNAGGLTDSGVTALFASSVSSTTSTTLKDRDCSVVAYSSGMTLTFTASTGLRQFEILITDCTAGGSINFPDVTYRGASDALTLEAGDNHLVFAEYAANCFFVTRSVANTITIS